MSRANVIRPPPLLPADIPLFPSRPGVDLAALTRARRDVAPGDLLLESGLEPEDALVLPVGDRQLRDELVVGQRIRSAAPVLIR
jgi:hypothetical protein